MTLIPTFPILGGGGTFPSSLGLVHHQPWCNLVPYHTITPWSKPILVGEGGTLPDYIQVHCKSVRFTEDQL